MMGRKSRDKQYVRFCRQCIIDAEKATPDEIKLANTVMAEIMDNITAEMKDNTEVGIDTDRVFKEHGNTVGSFVFVNLILANVPEKFRKKL